MNINKQILIHSLDVGYIVMDYTSNKKYAKETIEGVIELLRATFSVENNLFVKKVDQKDGSIVTVPAPKSEEPSQVVAASVPEHELKKTTAHQKIIELAQIKDPDGIFIPKFEYDPAQKKEIEGYSNMSVVELPDGRAMIQYNGAHYYTTKEKVMQKIPYPIPKNYFAGKGFSSIARASLRAYRYYLHYTAAEKKPDWDEIDWKDETGSIALKEHEAAAAMADKPAGSEDGTCDDVTFESCANNSPERCKFCVNESRFEDKNKLAANKPAPPLMRASVPP